jgi:ATP-binding protein involved in chromosome partitioning
MSNYQVEDVLKALSHVDDPDLHKDIVSLGMVREVKIVENTINFSVYLTTPACPMKDMIENACRNAIAHFMGEDVICHINMTADVSVNKKTNTALPNVKNIIAVASGKGGVGKSTVSAGIASVLAKSGAKVGLLDADIYGPSVPILFGVQNSEIEVITKNGIELMMPIAVAGVKLFSIGFLSKPNEAVVWRGPMVSQAIKQFITGVDWGDLDYLIVDLPPGTGDVQITITQTLPLTGVVIVSTPQNVAIADARKACAMLKMPSVNVPILGMVENMAYFIPEDAPDKQYFIFGKGGTAQLANEYQTTLLGQLPINQQMMNDADQGKIFDNKHLNFFTEIAGSLVRQIAILNNQQNSLSNG